MNLLRMNQRGNATIVVMVVILTLLLGFISWKVFIKGDETKPAATSQDTVQTDTQDESEEAPSAGGSILVVNSRNTVRRNDVTRLLTATAEYSLNNNGYLPGDYENGSLTGSGDPAETGLKHYETVKVEYGEHAEITSDAIVLVIGADCDAKNAAIASESSRSYVVLYGLEQTSGSFKPACEAV
jgi:hypothetical protein